MSLDETFRQMQKFHAELSRFNDMLLASTRNLQAYHDKVSPLWQDEMRREYDSQWEEFDEMMKQYLSRTAPNYTQFLDAKLRDLGRYLRGR
ncbi:MAG: hypothetical protein KME30_29590 [Iphinoe sp. HA4291-MV1]|jgi:uncharacterized protein YukE|nr:hypothetical protein [Iphinoe sp. HA4291-MV1]